jgi:hypothetical protein
MKHFDKFLLWLGRIVSLPMAGFCFYIVRQQWSEVLKGTGDASVFVAFSISGVFCVAYFVVLLFIKTNRREDGGINIVTRGGNKFKY